MRFLTLRRRAKIALATLPVAIAAAAAAIGCESQVLDPFPVENAGLSCATHGDCALPAAFCQAETGSCVECRSEDDCDRGTCDLVTHTCRRSCSTNDDCNGSRRDLCERARGICVECANDTHCQVGLAICREDVCIECMNDDDCKDGDEHRCEIARNRCRECLGDDDCPDGTHCDEDELRCESNSRQAN